MKRVVTIQLVSEDPGLIQTAHGFVRQVEPICDRTSITVLDEPEWQDRQNQTLDESARAAVVLLAGSIDVLAGMVAYREPYDNARPVLRAMQDEMARVRSLLNGEAPTGE